MRFPPVVEDSGLGPVVRVYRGFGRGFREVSRRAHGS